MTIPRMRSSTPRQGQMIQSPDRAQSGTVGDVERFIDDAEGRSAGDPGIETLSDLDRAAFALLRKRWSEIPSEERALLTRAMVEDAEARVERNYRRVFLVALNDEDPETRLAAVEGLWEYEELPLLESLMSAVETESDERVRAAQIVALGRFAVLAEIEEVEPAQAERLKDVLLRLADDDESIEVRRRAVESVSYFSGDDEVDTLIEDAYDSGIHENRVSAIHAMGRQASSRWLALCLDNLSDEEPEIRYEAVTAVGFIGDERSASAVVDLIADVNAGVRLAAVGALGAIGGPLAVNTLRRLASEDDPAIVEAAEDALQEEELVSNPLRPLL